VKLKWINQHTYPLIPNFKSPISISGQCLDSLAGTGIDILQIAGYSQRFQSCTVDCY
jgi:hypothetical protein